MYEQANKFINTIILFSFLAVSVFAPIGSAAYYEDSFPYDETGLTGGYYIECASSLGDIVLIIPQQYSDSCLTFTTSGNLFNVTSSSITCYLYLNGSRYIARFSAMSTLEYRVDSSYTSSYISVTTGEIYDTNVVFITSSNRVNENFYFSAYEICVLSLLLLILFFQFGGYLKCRKI